MKKFIWILLALCLLLGCVVGYAASKNGAKDLGEPVALYDPENVTDPENIAVPDEGADEGTDEGAEEARSAALRVLDYEKLYKLHAPEEIVGSVDGRELSWDEYMTALEEGRLEDDTEFDMYYAEVKLRNDFDLTELLQVRNKNNAGANLNYTRSTDRVFETYIYNYLAASDMDRANQYAVLAQYLLTTGSLITIGFERQELITHRGVCKGVDPNMGNPLYNFPNWEIDLEDR